jgi:branched-chain amino acid transport system permease protein
VLVIVVLPCLTRSGPFGVALVPDRWVTVGILGATYALLALGLVVVTGWSGQFVLGYAGFFAIGAYTYGLLNSLGAERHWGAALSVPIAVTLTATVAVALGLATGRVRGDYFALITMAFGEMVRIAIMNLRDVTGGNVGLLAIDPLTLWPGGPAVTTAITRYATGWTAVGLFAAWLWRVRRTPLGRAWVAVREDEEAARAIGIRSTRVKLAALMVAASAAGMAGCFFAASQLSLIPSTFSMLSSFIVVTSLVVGGMGSIHGAVLGTVLLLAIPELVRDLAGGGAALLDYQMMIYGAAMLAVILLRPEGLTREQVNEFQPVQPATPESVPGPGMSVRLRRLEVRYGGVLAVAPLDLDIPAGELVGVIGPNGSGKTTLVNVISGFHPAAGGSLELDGQAVTRWAPERRARLGVARTFQMNRLFMGISNAENVLTACDTVEARPGARDLFAARPRDLAAHARGRACLEWFPDRFPGWRRVQRPVALSYANRRRLEMARALGIRPRLLLLDEPTAGMNPVDRRQLLRQVRAWADAGTTVVIVEHQLGALAEVADRLIALDHGTVIADGPPAAVLGSPGVVGALMSMEPGAVDTRSA